MTWTANLFPVTQITRFIYYRRAPTGLDLHNAATWVCTWPQQRRKRMPNAQQDIIKVKLGKFKFDGGQYFKQIACISRLDANRSEELEISVRFHDPFKNSVPHWCANGRPLVKDLTDLQWMSNEPDNAFPPEGVMMFMFLDSGYGIGDTNSLMSAPYACQSLD